MRQEDWLALLRLAMVVVWFVARVSKYGVWAVGVTEVLTDSGNRAVKLDPSGSPL
jgi:hypothetical protein